MTLKRAAGRYKGLCPFHREKTPSFTVDPQRQMYKCFGCGVGGGVFKFIMAWENLDFPAAVKRLADRAGLVLGEDEWRGAGGPSDAEQKRRRRLLALHSEATEWFHRQLMKNPAAQAARDYLRGRGMGKDIAVRWQLGWAPDGWNQFRDWALGKDYRAGELFEGGLCAAKGRGGEPMASDDEPDVRPAQLYDRFRNRLMIPVRSEPGEVVAFSGRVLEADAKAAKYVNSPETPIFTKGALLFGLDRSRRAVIEAGRAIVCEGQLDLITAFEAGVTNVVAPQGTAFTPRQAGILRRCADEVVLCYDADAAGQQAAERSFAVLLEANVNVRVAVMPPGEDPDSLIRNRGADEFRERIAEARDFFDFQLERLASLFDLRTPRGQAQAARRMAESVRMVSDPTLRDAVANKVASRLSLPQERFRELLIERPPPRRLSQEDDGGGAPAAPAPGEGPPPLIAQLLVIALQHREGREWLRARPGWNELLAQAEGGEPLRRALAANFEPGDAAAVNAFIASQPPAEAAILETAAFESLLPNPLQTARDCWADFEAIEIQREYFEVKTRMDASDQERARLFPRYLELDKRLREIKPSGMGLG